MKYSDKDGFVIRLNDDRWEHIKYFHPEMEFESRYMSESLKDPDYLLSGNKDEILAVKKFEKTPVTNDKFCIVVYKRFVADNSGFIITSFFARSISKNRKVIWEKH